MDCSRMSSLVDFVFQKTNNNHGSCSVFSANHPLNELDDYASCERYLFFEVIRSDYCVRKHKAYHNVNNSKEA